MSSCSCHREVGPKVCWDALPQTQLGKSDVIKPCRFQHPMLAMLIFPSFVLATFWSQLLVTFFCRGSWSKVSFNWIHLVKSFMKGWNASWPGTLAASRIDSWQVGEVGWSWEPFWGFQGSVVPGSWSFTRNSTSICIGRHPLPLVDLQVFRWIQAMRRMHWRTWVEIRKIDWKKIWAIMSVSQWVRPFCWVLLFVCLTPLNLPYCWIFEWC